MDPLTVLTAAAEATSRIRLLTLVLGNDFRHPAILHKAVATLDVLSEGRVELGLGAGWLRADYNALGLAFDPPSTRLRRLEEAIDVLEGLFGGTPLDHLGPFYRIRGLEGMPKPVQVPHPPILVGGGGPKALDLAARRADIVGIHALLDTGVMGPEAAADLASNRVAAKVEQVLATWHTAGRSSGGPELQFSVYLCRITDRLADGRAAISTFAEHLATDPDLVATSPAVLVGSVAECVDRLREQRERHGLSYLNLGSDVQAVAPIVARLAGS